MSNMTKLILTVSFAVVPYTVNAQPKPWIKVCNELGAFAELLVEHKMRGRPVQEAFDDSLPVIQTLKDKVVADEIAKRIYSSKNQTREQEAEFTFKKCMELAESQNNTVPKPAQESAPVIPPKVERVPSKPDIQQGSITPRPPEKPTVPTIPAQPPKIANRPSYDSTKSSIDGITDLVPIQLEVGPNKIESFTSDGRLGIITLGWRAEEGGRGRDTFLITTQAKESANWNQVEIMPRIDAIIDGAVTNDPNLDHDTTRSIRFAVGKFKDRSSTLMFVTDRLKDSYSSTTFYEIYRLEEIGNKDVFIRIVQRTLKDKYCNADLALSDESGLPLSPSYKGPRDTSGNVMQRGCRT